MLVEVDAVDAATNLAVLQHTLGTVSERNDAHALGTDGDVSHHVVHLAIRNALGSHVAAHPGIQDTRAVDAEQYAQTVEFLGVVHVSKGVHATLRVVVGLAEHTVNHTAGACRRCNLAGVEHVERKCIVGLVAATI